MDLALQLNLAINLLDLPGRSHIFSTHSLQHNPRAQQVRRHEPELRDHT